MLPDAGHRGVRRAQDTCLDFVPAPIHGIDSSSLQVKRKVLYLHTRIVYIPAQSIVCIERKTFWAYHKSFTCTAFRLHAQL